MERRSIRIRLAEEDPPSVFSEKDNLEKLKAEQNELEKQKEKIADQQEKERLIQEEKEIILQEKIDELFKEFEALNPRDLESVFKNGRTLEGGNFKSSAMGELDPETGKSLARAFKEGIKLLPKILEILPELLKKYDGDLTKEATERVEQKMEGEKEKMEEEQKEKEISKEGGAREELETPESRISANETGEDLNHNTSAIA